MPHNPFVTVARWGLEGMEAAREAAKLSLHPRSKVGCALIDICETEVVTGHNFNPTPDKPDADWIHAEVLTIAKAARFGIETQSASMAVNWFPCLACAKVIVLAGVRTLYYDKAAANARWDDPKYNFQASYDYLESQGVELVGL